MNRCLICFNRIEETINNHKVCKKCLSKFVTIEKIFYIDEVEMLVLYLYDDFFRELLYRYKGCYDIALKDAFLSNYLVKLKRKYKDYKIVCAPSYIKDDEIRGFNHIKEIAKLFELEVIDCLRKRENYKQSSKKYSERGQIQNIIRIDKSKLIGVKRVLILDDVTTTLSTIKTIIRLLPTRIDKKVLVLSSNCRFLENENI